MEAVQPAPISSPEFRRADFDFDVHFKDEQLHFRFESVNETATGMVHAELSVTSDLPSIAGQEIAWDRLQLNSSSGRERVALAITRAYQGSDVKKPDERYVTMLHEACRGVARRLRQGEEIEHIESPQRRQGDAYLLRPLVMDGQINGIYGDGGTGKGWIAIGAMVALLHGKLDLGMPGKVVKRVLYVDHETDRPEIEDRVSRLCDGMGIRRLPFDYHRASMAIPQEVRALRRQMQVFDLVIWDSLGPGMTEHANDAGVAAACLTALRTLETTVLFLDHTNKAGGQMGSRYKFDLCRNLWLAQKRIEDGVHRVTLFDKKGNNTGGRSSFGLEFRFDGETGPVRIAAGRAHTENPTGGRPRKYESDTDRKKAWREAKRPGLHLIDSTTEEDGDE